MNRSRISRGVMGALGVLVLTVAAGGTILALPAAAGPQCGDPGVTCTAPHSYDQQPPSNPPPGGPSNPPPNNNCGDPGAKCAQEPTQSNTMPPSCGHGETCTTTEPPANCTSSGCGQPTGTSGPNNPVVPPSTTNTHEHDHDGTSTVLVIDTTAPTSGTGNTVSPGGSNGDGQASGSGSVRSGSAGQAGALSGQQAVSYQATHKGLNLVEVAAIGFALGLAGLALFIWSRRRRHEVTA